MAIQINVESFFSISYRSNSEIDLKVSVISVNKTGLNQSCSTDVNCNKYSCMLVRIYDKHKHDDSCTSVFMLRAGQISVRVKCTSRLEGNN